MLPKVAFDDPDDVSGVTHASDVEPTMSRRKRE
jgi:hypothetical protein